MTLPTHHLGVVLHAQMVLADLAFGTIFVVVTHWALIGAVLGLAVAFPVTAVENSVPAVTIGPAATLSIVGLTKLEFATRFLGKGKHAIFSCIGNTLCSYCIDRYIPYIRAIRTLTVVICYEYLGHATVRLVTYAVM